jgi:hypothetical protein
MNRYEVRDRSGNGIATFVVAFPTPTPTATPTPMPTATPTPTPLPTPKPTPKPFVPKKGWAIGFYVGAASSSHTNVSSSGSGQSQSWKGNQLHLHGDANRLYPLIGNWYPELEFRSNQLGSIAGLTAVSGHLHWNLNKGNRALLLVGLGGNLIGMNGTSDYGIITSIAWSTHAVWRTTDRKFAIGATYGPLLSPVPGLSSTWIGLNADYRINLFHSGIHLGADVNWMTVPSSVSGVNVNYSSNSYALMMGYYFGE